MTADESRLEELIKDIEYVVTTKRQYTPVPLMNSAS